MVPASKLLCTSTAITFDGLRSELNLARLVADMVRVKDGEARLVQVVGMEVFTRMQLYGLTALEYQSIPMRR